LLKMKKSFFVLVTAVIVITCVLVGLTNWSRADGSGALPGSELDPIVTKSYVDYIAATLRTYLEEAISRKAESQFRVVSLHPGQKLVGNQGTEIILRSGRAIAVTSSSGGLSDITRGADIKANEPIPANHLLIVPRSDGRGLKAETEVIIMIRGEFGVE